MSEGTGRGDIATYQTIVSPEQVAIELPLAGPGSRILAYAIDWAVVLVAQLGLAALAISTAMGVDAVRDWMDELRPDAATPDEQLGAVVLVVMLIMFLAQFALELVYFASCEVAWGGRSVGKRVVGLRVVRENGLPIGLRESLVRNLLRIVDALPSGYLVGLTSVVATERAQRLGDLAAGTLVVRMDREPLAPLALDLGEDLSRFRFAREQLDAIGPAELRLARRALRTLPSLGEDRRAQVLERACAALCSRMGIESVAPAERAPFLRAIVRARTRS